MNPEVIHTAHFAEDAANRIIAGAREAIAQRGAFRLGLAGGNTPRGVYSILARRVAEIDWSRTTITFGDERCVPPEHELSNYRMAKESLLDLVPLPPANLLRIRGELTAEEAALDYEASTSKLAQAAGEGRYTHDILLLGIGDDGHTASLFPGSDVLAESTRNFTHNHHAPKVSRVTATYPLIHAARRVIFLVEGAGKRAVVEGILKGDSQYPASAVSGVAPTTWFLGYPAEG